MAEQTRQEGLVMVCVTIQRSCERLIRAGRDLAEQLNIPLAVVHVAREGDTILGNPDEGMALDFLFDMTSASGARMQVLRSNQVLQTLADYARENGVTRMVMGAPRDGTGIKSLIEDMHAQLPCVIFHIVPD